MHNCSLVSIESGVYGTQWLTILENTTSEIVDSDSTPSVKCVAYIINRLVTIVYIPLHLSVGLIAVVSAVFCFALHGLGIINQNSRVRELSANAFESALLQLKGKFAIPFELYPLVYLKNKLF